MVPCLSSQVQSDPMDKVLSDCRSLLTTLSHDVARFLLERCAAWITSWGIYPRCCCSCTCTTAATAATATPPLIGAKPLNSKKIAFHPVFSFQDDGKFMAESSSVFQTSLPGGRCTREALGRTGEGPCERSIQNTARLVRTRFRIGKKREEVDTFLRPGKGGQGNACKGWDHYDMILNTARVVVTHRSLR